MVMKKIFLIFNVFICSVYAHAQIEISDLVQENYINQHATPKLYYIDFWATYCGPCEFVSKQLNVLQRQYPNDLYVVSLTKENPNIVKDFLIRKPTNLAVAVDYQGSAFDMFEVKYMPYGVLFDGKGNVLWQGKAAEMDAKMIERFLRRSQKHYTPQEFFPIVQTYFEEEMEEEEILEENYEINEIPKEDVMSFTEMKRSNFHYISGSLKALTAYLLGVSEAQVRIDEKDNTAYEIKYKKGIDYSKLLRKLRKKAGIKIHEEDVVSNVHAVDFTSDALFWNETQIDWGDDTPNIMLGDSDFIADNISVDEAMRILSNVLEKPVILKSSNYNKDTLYDWEIHYLYENLMQDSLGNYGITIQEESAMYTQFIITKKDSFF